MSYKNRVKDLWNNISIQNWNVIKDYFDDNAVIYWHNTNEKFTINNFITANSVYPGNWEIEVQRLEEIGDLVISVVLVTSKEDGTSFYATSFFQFKDDSIIEISEYWSDNGEPPQWRKNLNIAKPIIE
ncbi:nuclear transport factor 2 family protein [Paludicola sp. MB14-C6]|uniref:nuclear transport factor 2 family protein n=1 Tax=Paludihabitans sp. MB14-C6 TaxID=3070656 RepID=UPI0027DE36E8|nr:nuclear transport factor 2 family protein [Paludicola sp. MB14-C6]WMJ23313.1 nuclear transport factor 2 family protein [Paludicola sp. MB14-C6]